MKCMHCRRAVLAKGLCSLHYFRASKGHPVDGKPRASRKQPPKPCAVAACERPARAKQLCTTHYAALHRRPSPLSALLEPLLRVDQPQLDEVATQLGRDMLEAAIAGMSPRQAANHVLARFVARRSPKDKT